MHRQCDSPCLKALERTAKSVLGMQYHPIPILRVLPTHSSRRNSRSRVILSNILYGDLEGGHDKPLSWTHCSARPAHYKDRGGGSLNTYMLCLSIWDVLSLNSPVTGQSTGVTSGSSRTTGRIVQAKGYMAHKGSPAQHGCTNGSRNKDI